VQSCELISAIFRAKGFTVANRSQAKFFAVINTLAAGGEGRGWSGRGRLRLLKHLLRYEHL
jgi:hypothetical protein